MGRFIFRILAVFGVLLLAATGAGAQDKIVLGTGIGAPLVDAEDGTPGFLEGVAKEAFRRIGYELEIVILPAERVLVNANEGIEDGNLFRIAGLNKFYPNLIQVPEKFFESEFVAYTTGADTTIDGWKGLEGRDVAYVNGWKIFENNVKGARSVEKVRTADQMFSLLTAKRTEFALYERWQGLKLARDLGIEGVHAVEPPFVTMDMFMYLHKKHEAVVPRLAAALRSMKDDGTYQQIFQDTLGKLSQSP